MYRCHPQTAALVRLVRDGAIGKVRLIQAAFSVARDFDAEHRMFKKDLGGGAILDLGCYPVSFARLIASAAAGQTVAEPIEFRATGRLHPLNRSPGSTKSTILKNSKRLAILKFGEKINGIAK